MMRENEKNLFCYICGQTFIDPVIVSSCGHSFDRDCIVNYTYCPIPSCQMIVSAHGLLPNYQLRESIKQTSCPVYETFLIDTSTSMWYSDSFLGFFGRGRFDLAIEFLRSAFKERKDSVTRKVSLVTFDVRPVEKFAFDHIRQEHLKIVDRLEPTGYETSMFDGIKLCLERFELIDGINPNATQYLYVLTDGGDDFSSSGVQRHYIEFILKKLCMSHVNPHLIHIGDKNMRSMKVLCQQINFNYQHFNQNDINPFSRTFSQTSSSFVQQKDLVMSQNPSTLIGINDEQQQRTPWNRGDRMTC